MIMVFDYIFVFLGIAVLSCMSCRNSTVGMIKEIGTNSRYYPKHYIIPKRWMKNLFHIKQCVIPRYLYFELLLSLFFLFLGLLNIVICIAVDCDMSIVGILIMFHICLIIGNMIFFSSMSLLFKKR